MEVPNRELREKELEAVLASVWMEWTDIEDPSFLSEETLVRLLRERCLDAVWAVWILANQKLLEEFEEEQNANAASAAFMLFFGRWTRDIASRWKARVIKFRQEESERRRQFESAPRTIFTVLGDPAVVSRNQDPLRSAVDPYAPREWGDARGDAFTQSDAEMTAVTAVTETQSDAEIAGTNVLRARGKTIIEVWRTEPGACDICEPLEGTTREVWGAKFPRGTPAHKRCRCWIEHVAI